MARFITPVWFSTMFLLGATNNARLETINAKYTKQRRTYRDILLQRCRDALNGIIYAFVIPFYPLTLFSLAVRAENHLLVLPIREYDMWHYNEYITEIDRRVFIDVGMRSSFIKID